MALIDLGWRELDNWKLLAFLQRERESERNTPYAGYGGLPNSRSGGIFVRIRIDHQLR